MRWLLLFMALLAVPALAQTRNADEYFFQPHFGDLKSDIADAGKQGKTGVLLMFEQPDCPFCAHMEDTVLNQIDVQNYFRKHFLIYTMDTRGDDPVTDFGGKDTTARAFSLSQRARATPTFIFYGLDGKEMARFTGVTRNVGEFMLLGRYVVRGAYKKEPFEIYEKRAVPAQ